MDEIKKDYIKIWLSTYGWAIIAAVIAIGTLAYFGIFSPNNNSINYNKCLKNYAKEYCINNNMTYVEINELESSFRCERKNYNDIDYRNNGVFNRPTFYLLPSEMDDCKKNGK